MKKKILNFIYSTRHKLKEGWAWHKSYFYFKWSIPFGAILQGIGFIFKTVVIFASFFGIAFSSGMVFVTEQCIPYINIDFITEYITKEGLLSSQITLTLICVSLIALVANIENRYVYGEQSMNLAFPGRGPFSFKGAMAVSFLLLFVNIYWALKDVPLVYVALIFLITIYQSVWILYRFATVFLNQNAMKQKLLRKYYICNQRQLKKERPLEHYISVPLDNLKATTLKHLICNNIPELNENMRLYFKLVELTLFNKSKLVQEYYTESVDFQDVIGHIIEISMNMLHLGKPLYGLTTYNALLKKLNYFKIVGTTSIMVVSPAHSFFAAFFDITKKTELTAYIDQLLLMNANLIEQYYLQTTVDLSYCRLAKDNLIFFHTYNYLYEKLYEVIKKSPILSADDKDYQIETVRLSVVHLYLNSDFHRDIDCFWSKIRFPKEKRIFRLDIKGEPVAKLLLRMIESGDTNNLRMYQSLGTGHTSAYFAKIMASLSVLNMVYRGNKREYLYDLNIEKVEVKQLFKDCKMLNINAGEAELQEFYDFIIKHYIKDPNTNTTEGGIYSFSPKFRFDKCVVDTYFAYLFNKLDKEATVESISQKYNYEYNPDVKKLIQDFT